MFVKVFLVTILVGQFENALSHPNKHPVENYTGIQPHFEQSFYTKRFKDGILEELVIRVINAIGVFPVFIEDEMSKFFEVIATPTIGEYVVKSKDYIRWTEEEDAIFTLSIDDASLISPVQTVVIVKWDKEVPRRPPHFEHSVYTKEFVDGILDDLRVKVIDGIGVVPIIAESDIRDYFEITYLPTADEEYIIRSINGKKWNKNQDAIFTLMIDDPTLFPPVETVVIVKTDLRPPYFERSLYISTFKDGILEELVIRVINDIGVPLVFIEDEMTKYFEVIATPNAGEYVARSKGYIRWTKEEDAIFTLRIDDYSLFFPVETVVIVKREKEVPRRPPYFEYSVYTKEFVDGILDDLRVKVIDGIGVVPIIAESDIRDYFEITYLPTADEEYIIRSINGKKWNKNQDAIFTLMIDDPTLFPPVETVVIVKTDLRPPYFERSLYISTFKDGILEELVIRVSNDFGVFPVIIEDEMSKFFEVIATPTAGEYVVKSKVYIHWTEEEDAIFTLSIDDASLISPVKTVVIVKREKEDLRLPHFEHSVYTKEFVDGILDDLRVKVIDGLGVGPTIAETDLQVYFEVISITADDEYIVQSKYGKKWTKNQDAIFTLQIDDPSLIFPVETVVIVKRKEVGQPEQPRFEKSHYRGTYENGQLSISDDIRLEGNGRGDIRFEDAEMEHIFSVQNTNGLVTIEKIGPIEVDVEEILLTLIAENNGLEGSTVVLIKIIKVDSSCEGGNKYTLFLGDNHGVIVGM